MGAWKPCNVCRISIHALLAESDFARFGRLQVVHYFYPRSPCGERLFLLRKITITVDISIHALLAESDVEKVPADVYYQAFLSTLSLRRATPTPSRNDKNNVFLSTLSLRRATESIGTLRTVSVNFYPRSPCGERRVEEVSGDTWARDFYPRSPCGERPNIERGV